MDYTIIAYSEFFGFCSTMIFMYYADKWDIEEGIITEEEVKDELWMDLLFSVFWFLFWPLFFYGIYQDRNNP